MAFQVIEQLSPKQKEKRAKEMIQWLEANGFTHLLAPKEEETTCGSTNQEA